MYPFRINPRVSESLPDLVRWVRDATTILNEFIRSMIPDVESVSSNFSTTRSAAIVATSNITITLNATPADQETVIVKRVTAAGNVTVSGNGNNIDGAASSTLSTNYDSLTVRYFDSAGS